VDNYAVIGHPVRHSLSPAIHTEFARQTGEILKYTAIEAPLDRFSATVRAFIQAGGKGINVTVPFKPEAYQLADERSELAEQALAANTLMFREDGSVFADSTDGIGLLQDLTGNHDYTLRQKKILLIGAGGAARCVLGPIISAAPAECVIANRTADKAYALAEQYQLQGQVQGAGLSELIAEPYDLIINATSAGLSGEAIDLPAELIASHTWCYDMVYGKEPTPFLQWAHRLGAQQCLDGLGMLVEQAAAAFYLWRGVYPDTKSVKISGIAV